MLLNLLQAQQQQGGGGFASPFAATQGMPMSMGQQQQMPQEMMQQPMEQPAPTSPFDVGISRAVQSSRAALQMAPDQEGRALRKAMMGFGESIGAQPVRRGFMNNLGQGLKALGPGVAAHDEAEAAAQMENQAMAEKLIAHQMAKREYEDRMAQKAMDNEFRERALGETRRAHDLHYKAAMGRAGQSGMEGGVGIDSKFSPITTKQELARHSKKKSELGTVKKELEELKDSYESFRKNHEKDLIDPMGGYGPVKNAYNSVAGKFFDSAEGRKQSAEYKTLKSRQNKFVAASEKALKGGVLGPRTIELFAKQGIYPDVDKDTPEEYAGKLKTIVDEIDSNHKAADYSLRYRVNIDPTDLTEFESYINPGTDEQVSEEEKIYFLHPETGQKIGIPTSNTKAIKKARMQQLQEV